VFIRLEEFSVSLQVSYRTPYLKFDEAANSSIYILPVFPWFAHLAISFNLRLFFSIDL